MATATQPLLRPVVQVALEPPPLVVATAIRRCRDACDSSCSRWCSSAIAAAELIASISPGSWSSELS